MSSPCIIVLKTVGPFDVDLRTQIVLPHGPVPRLEITHKGYVFTTSDFWKFDTFTGFYSVVVHLKHSVDHTFMDKGAFSVEDRLEAEEIIRNLKRHGWVSKNG